MIFAGLAIIVAQSCAAFLPPPDLQIDWSRNGQPFARDVPVRTSDDERVYRRSFRNGSPDVTRILSCSGDDSGAVLHDRVGAGTDVMIPLQLSRTRTITLNGATVRRIDAPDDAGHGGTWFSVSRYGPQLFGVRERIGIEEIRTPAVSGRVEVLRAVLTAIERTAPGAPVTTDDRAVRRLNAQLAEQERIVRELRDTLLVRTGLSEQQRLVFEDSLRKLEVRGISLSSSYVPRAARLLADSAARLPSEGEARARGWIWPGAGHSTMNRSGAFWATTGFLAAGTAIAGAAIPDATYSDLGLDPDRVRPAAVLGGAGAYLFFLLVSQVSLASAIADQRADYATRESFLRAATVEVSPSGSLIVTVRRGVR